MGDLLDLEFVSHVSLVDDPAVDDAEYLVAKRAESEDLIPGSDSSPGGTEAEKSPTEVIKNMSDSDTEELAEAIKEAAAEGVQEGLQEAETEEPESPEEPEAGSGLEEQVETLTEQVSTLTEALSPEQDGEGGSEGQEAEGEDPEGEDPEDDSLEKRLETLEKAVEQGSERRGAASILDGEDQETSVAKADQSGVVDTAGVIQKNRQQSQEGN